MIRDILQIGHGDQVPGPAVGLDQDLVRVGVPDHLKALFVRPVTEAGFFVIGAGIGRGIKISVAARGEGQQAQVRLPGLHEFQAEPVQLLELLGGEAARVVIGPVVVLRPVFFCLVRRGLSFCGLVSCRLVCFRRAYGRGGKSPEGEAEGKAEGEDQGGGQEQGAEPRPGLSACEDICRGRS